MPDDAAPDPSVLSELIVKQTLMAAERTWLTWWRSALVAAAGGLAVGRVTPEALHVASWPYVLLGVGYGVLALGLTIVGARRHRRLRDGILTAADAGIDTRAVALFSAGGIVIALCTIALVLAQS